MINNKKGWRNRKLIELNIPFIQIDIEEMFNNKTFEQVTQKIEDIKNHIKTQIKDFIKDVENNSSRYYLKNNKIPKNFEEIEFFTFKYEHFYDDSNPELSVLVYRMENDEEYNKRISDEEYRIKQLRKAKIKEKINKDKKDYETWKKLMEIW